VSKVNKDNGATPSLNHEPPPIFQSLDTPTYIDTPSSINKFDEAVPDAFATTTRYTMGAKSESMMAAFEQACTTLQLENQEFHRQLLIENQEFHRQLLIDMQTFQRNMFPTIVTTCQQNPITVNSVTNYQAASQQAQSSLLELSMEPQILADSPILNALDTCLDIPPTSSAQSDDPKLATKPYSCNSTRYPYSKMSTCSVWINKLPCRTWEKITLHLVFNVSLSNFSYVDPPLPQPHCLNLPPSRAKKKGVYSYCSI